MTDGDLVQRVNKLPKWAREYVHQLQTFIGAPEVEELIQLRDERRMLVKLIGKLRAENGRLKKVRVRALRV